MDSVWPISVNRELMRARQERDIANLCHTIAYYIQPFPVRHCSVQVIDRWTGVLGLKVWIDLLPYDPVEIVPDLNFLLGDYAETVIEVGHKAGLAFRALLNEPVPDNVTLGEN